MSNTQIVIRPMQKKELASLCGCSEYVLRKMLTATSEAIATFGEWKGQKKLSKAQVKAFFKHNDILPETIEL